MEANQLPTKPGPYYWRESDGDAWELWHVLDNGSELTAHRGFNVAFLPDLGGQWLPIPTAEELVELQSKAKAYDEGQHEWGLFDTEGKFAITCPNEQKHLANGWTCSKVRVCKEVDE